MSDSPKLETTESPSTLDDTAVKELERPEISVELPENENKPLEKSENLNEAPITSDSVGFMETDKPKIIIEPAGKTKPVIEPLEKAASLDGQPSSSPALGPMETDKSEMVPEQEGSTSKPTLPSTPYLDQEDAPIRNHIYSNSSATFSSKNICMIHLPKETDIGPYKWQVKWYIKHNVLGGPSTSSDISRMLVVEILKKSNYIFDWKFRLTMEFQDSQRQPIPMFFDVYDTPVVQKYEINEATDENFAKIHFYSTVTIQFVSTSMNHIWEHCATEVDLEDPNRTHDFILMASDSLGRDEKQREKKKIFYVHLSYLRSWSGFFAELLAPASPYVVNEDPKTVSILLTILHPNMADVLNDGNVIKVLNLAKKWKIWNVVNKIAEILCDSKKYRKITMIRRLDIGHSCKQRKLMIESLKEIQLSTKEEKRHMVQNDLKIIKNLPSIAMAELLIALTNNTRKFGENVLEDFDHQKVDQIVPKSECDRTITLIDGEIPVNSYVLATWSPFFDDLFFNNPATMNEAKVHIEYVLTDYLNIILRLVQTKSENILSTETVYAVLELSSHLKMPSIVAMCSAYMNKNGFHGPSEGMYFLNLAVRVDSGNLIDAALHKIANIYDKQSFTKNNLENISTFKGTARNNITLAIATLPEITNQTLRSIDGRKALIRSTTSNEDKDLLKMMEGYFD